CFVAGLADLVFDANKSYMDMTDFQEELKIALHPGDYSLVSILFLPHDNKNIVAFLEGKDDSWDPLGNYSSQDFEEQKRIIFSILKEKNILPDYLVGMIAAWFEAENGLDKIEMANKLTEGYINMALNSGNRFLENWISFERDLNNIFILLNSKSLNLDAGSFFIGNDPFTKELADISDRGKDFSIPYDPEYASLIFKIAADSEFLERERRIDYTRWEFIDSLTSFDYFTIDLILAYLVKYSIVLRWNQLEPETGKMMLQKLLDDMEAPVLSGNYIVK
ncbi:MAG TPA: DUF2764 family protein, partial [Bacteroidales bacterium]|nr:DUF2764 family protein [Bacteroidales bacterium]